MGRVTHRRSHKPESDEPVFFTGPSFRPFLVVKTALLARTGIKWQLPCTHYVISASYSYLPVALSLYFSFLAVFVLFSSRFSLAFFMIPGVSKRSPVGDLGLRLYTMPASCGYFAHCFVSLLFLFSCFCFVFFTVFPCFFHDSWCLSSPKRSPVGGFGLRLYTMPASLFCLLLYLLVFPFKLFFFSSLVFPWILVC